MAEHDRQRTFERVGQAVEWMEKVSDEEYGGP
jgi:hypothetical protein